jgi:hypothetical protein
VLKQAILGVYASNGGTDEQWTYVYNAFISGAPQTQFGLLKKIC